MSEPQQTADDKAKKAAFEGNKLSKRLRHHVGAAINDFNMIEEGDRVMVCLSGGKDSYGLLDILLGLQKSAPINFSIVKRLIPEGKTTCSLCSRLRRGILDRVADELGATKIALGHHRDDMLHTLFLNMFYGGKLKSMPPKLVSDDGRHMVIRPLAYCREKDLERYAALRAFPIIPCNLCGSQPNLQRQVVKEMVNDWDKRFPGRVESMFRAMQNVVPSHLADTKLFDFAGLQTGDSPFEGGDTAFDKEEFRDPVALAEDDDGEPMAAKPRPRRTISILDSRPKADSQAGDSCGGKGTAPLPPPC